MINGIERVIPTLNFDLRGVEVQLHGVRQDRPPKMVSVDYLFIVDIPESDHRLELLHSRLIQVNAAWGSNPRVVAVRLIA